MDNWDDFRTENSGAGKGISFGQIGDMSQQGKIKGGRILEILPKQEQRDFEDKSVVRTTKTGKTLWQLPIRVQTGEGRTELCRESADDDGVRVLYVKGLMFDAIDEALKKANVESPTVGGLIEIAYVGNKAVGTRKMRAFAAMYTPGAPPVETGDLFPGAAAAATPQQPLANAAGVAPGQQVPTAFGTQTVQQPTFAAAAPQQQAPNLGQQWAQAGAPQQGATPAGDPWAAQQPEQQAPATVNPFG